VAWVIAKRNRAVFVVDFFVGLVETLVVDRAIVQKSSMRGRILAACDSFAARSADVLVTDTRVRAERLSARPKIVHPALSLPVGAPEWARPRPKPRGDEVRENTKLLYYGNYVPLHGVPTLLEGIAAISPTVHWTLTMVGRGQDLGLALEACDRLGISDRTTFVDSVPEAALADLIHEHDVVLGIFGQSDKAATVIANKVWQGLACGKVVVTRRSPALAEIEDIVGSLLEQVDSADAPAITAALTAIAKRAATPDAQSYSGADVADALETYVAEKYAAFGDRLRELAAQR
jgi:glycosyltransferase involved in cell wall biosynthesis